MHQNTSSSLSPKMPSVFKQLWLISSFEIGRLFQTKRGLFSLLAFALIWYFLFRYGVLKASNYLVDPNVQKTIADTFSMSSLTRWPAAEVLMYWLISLLVFPIFSLFITADQLATDKTRGTFRFLTLRTSRDCLLFGRFIGQMLIMLTLVCFTLIAAVIMAWWREPNLLMSASTSAMWVFTNLFVTLLPCVALMTLCSALAQTVRSATFYAIILSSGLIILVTLTAFYFPIAAIAGNWLFGAQIPFQITQVGWNILSNSSTPLVQTFILLALARVVFNKVSL